MSELSDNPYLGPRTFEEQHAHLFFGREREARELLSTVISEPLVLFYAPSGAGKSSLINTRLVPGLREEGFHVLPIGRFGWTPADDTLQADNIFIYDLLSNISPDVISSEELANTSLIDFVQLTREAMDDPGQPLVLIVDQFEELVTRYQGFWYQRESFFHQLNEALEADSLLWVVLATREDYIAAIEPYTAGLPGQLLMRYQMQRMRYPAALDAIRRPAADHDRPFAEEVAEALVDNLRQIHAYETEDIRMGEYVEPVQLQVVCYQLWENLKEQPPGEITAAEVDQLGDVDLALAEFYQQAIADALSTSDLTELELRTWFESKLITEDGTRGTVYQGPEEAQGLPNEAVRQLADRYLLRSVIRAGGTWYELVHDRLVKPILESNASWRHAQGPVLNAAEAWEKGGRGPRGLYEGEQLNQEMANLDESAAEPLVKEFLAAGRAAQLQKEEKQAAELETAQAEAERQKQRADEQAKTSFRLRLLAAGLVVFFLAAAALAILYVRQLDWQSELAEENTVLEARAKLADGNATSAAEQAESAAVFATSAAEQAALAGANATLAGEYANLSVEFTTALASNESSAAANASLLTSVAAAAATGESEDREAADVAQSTAAAAATRAANVEATASAVFANATATKIASPFKYTSAPVFLRAGPSVDSLRLGTLDTGTKVQVIEEGVFAHVHVNDTKGYIHSDNLLNCRPAGASVGSASESQVIGAKAVI
ncbi:MAG: SH3 domain-containing protein, partial [Chloroflexota bacterium]